MELSRPLAGELWEHRKTGNTYVILEVGKHSETLEELVVYRRYWVQDVQVWIRPLQMFMDGRFVKISDADNSVEVTS